LVVGDGQILQFVTDNYAQHNILTQTWTYC